MNKNVESKIINYFKNIKNNDNIYLATWLLREIIFNKPLDKYSEELAILIFIDIYSILSMLNYIYKIFNYKTLAL